MIRRKEHAGQNRSAVPTTPVSAAVPDEVEEHEGTGATSGSGTTNVDQEAFARRWAETIVGTSYVSVESGELARHLLELTQRLIEATLSAEFDSSVARRIGIDMVVGFFTDAETFSKTLALIADGLPGLLRSAPPGVDVAGRVAQLVGSMAAGYAGALRVALLDDVSERRQLLSHAEGMIYPDLVIGPDKAEADGMLSEARAECEQLLSDARTNAESMVNEARIQAETMLSNVRTIVETLDRQSQERAASLEHGAALQAEIIVTLSEKKSTLEREIEDLRIFEREYRTRVKTYLESQLRELEGLDLSYPPTVEEPSTVAGSEPLGGQ